MLFSKAIYTRDLVILKVKKLKEQRKLQAIYIF